MLAVLTACGQETGSPDAHADAAGATRKPFRIQREQIRPVVENRGSCFASDLIIVGGARVGRMYRVVALTPSDSGWRFLAGDEPQATSPDPRQLGTYDVNTVANVDLDIVKFLDQPAGSVYVRDASGNLVRSSESSVEVRNVLTLPDIEGEVNFDDLWTLHLPGRFQRRIEDESLVLHRPGLTFWMLSWGRGHDDVQAIRSLIKDHERPEAFDVREEEVEGLWRLSYRVHEAAPDQRRSSLTVVIQEGSAVINCSAYFDDESDLATAFAVLRSVRVRRT